MKWISYFGAHKRILSDGGQEFQNEEMAEFTKKWGIELSCTANESSQTKGKYKKVLGLLKEIMRKLKEERVKRKEIGLAWAIAAKIHWRCQGVTLLIRKYLATMSVS